jgi:glycosyltransferase involved in cell wall biosynthesis
MDKMRVIFITTYPKSGDGIAHYSRYLLRELSRRVHINLICLFWRANNGFLKEIRAFSSLIDHYLSIKKINPDVIHIQFTTELYPKFFFLIFLLLLKTLKIPLIITQHEVNIEKRFFQIRTLFYEKPLYKLVDVIIIHSEFARNQLRLKGVAGNHIMTLPHGVHFSPSVDKFHSRDMIEIDHKAKVVLFLGFILPHKGIEYVITALPNIIQRFPKTLFIVAGETKDVDYLRTLKKLVEERALHKNVKFTGYVPEDQLNTYLSSADVVVLPYSSITQSGILPLAVGAGIPVVASAVGGLKEVLKKHFVGLLVPPTDGKKLAQAIVKLLSNASLYQLIKKNELNMAKKWSWKNVSKNHVLIYRHLARF